MDDDSPLLWNEIFISYYLVSLHDMVLERLISRWYHLDILSKYLIAITATGSAVSGWAVWDSGAPSVLWLILSSSAALLSFLYGVIPVSDKLKGAHKSIRQIGKLKNKFESLMLDYRMAGEKIIELDFKKRLEQLNDSFVDVAHKSPTFPFVTGKFKDSVQDDLDMYLKSKGLI